MINYSIYGDSAFYFEHAACNLSLYYVSIVNIIVTNILKNSKLSTEYKLYHE